ncbi:MAG: tautomerase family protein [Chloroflexota bacterium]
MPVIEVKMYAGRTHEQKAELARRLTEGTMEALGVGPEAVRVIIYDIPRENWAVAGKLVVDTPKG